MSGLHFNSLEVAAEVLQERWAQVFRNWLERMHKCIEYEHEYFLKNNKQNIFLF